MLSILSEIRIEEFLFIKVLFCEKYFLSINDVLFPIFILHTVILYNTFL